MSDFVVAIPARYASTRLPGKPLCNVGGIPMIRRVCLQALKSNAKQVIACIDDQRVGDVLKNLDVTTVYTSKSCKCGTDRIAEMLSQVDLGPNDIIVNIQGDEPLIDPKIINDVANLLITNHADMATMCAKISNINDLFDPNCVKVIFNKFGYALYFSRAPIPYERDNFNKQNISLLKYDHYHHIGIYAYKVRTILNFYKHPQSWIEQSESLEQLRLLYNGLSIIVGVTDNPPVAGVDTLEDLLRVNKFIENA